MRYTIVGTAGHVDHGKTELIKALTGVETDRLKEEKERGISIELGFASMTLPGSKTVAFVDVPGHEKFIRQMIAGAGSMEVFLLTVAADEGLMPQTREHLDIISILGIKHGLAAVTKADLVSEERLNEVVAAVKDFLKSTLLKDIPVIPVSAKTGEGISELISLLGEVVDRLPERSPGNYMRMPIDRVFTIKGAGTVIAGTLWSGEVSIGDTIEIVPLGAATRVRKIQVHGKDVERASAGHRAALNIAGLSKEAIERGNIAQTPGYLEPCKRADVEIVLLKDAGKPLKNRQRVRVYHGTAEIFGRVVMLDRDYLNPGERAYTQLILEKPLVAAPGDRYVLRTYSPLQTIGGGVIVNPGAPKRSRFDELALKKVETFHKGRPEEKAAVYADEARGKLLEPEKVAKKLGFSKEELLGLAGRGGKIRVLGYGGRSFLTAENYYLKIVKEVQRELKRYHRKYPLRRGMPKEELRSSVFRRYDSRGFEIFLNGLEKDKILLIEGETVRLYDFQPEPNEKQRQKIAQIEEKLLANPFQPLLWSLILKEVFYFNKEEGEELLRYLRSTGRVVRVADDLYFHARAVERAKSILKDYLDKHGSITVAEARDLLDSSRKFVVPLLEYLDEEGFTKREGNLRYLRLQA